MKRAALLAFVLSLAISCNFMQKVKDSASELFGDEVVAKVGDRKLYRSELDAYIPDGVSKEDSSALAMQFINTWATDLVFLDVAESELSKEEKDVASIPILPRPRSGSTMRPILTNSFWTRPL